MSGTASPAANAETVVPGGDGKELSCKVFREGKRVAEPRDLSEISEILKERDCLVWLDVVDPGPNDLTLLQEEFDLHPLAIEDAIQAHQRPKIESYSSYWFVVVQGVTMAEERVTFHEIAIFSGRNFLVTVRHEPAYELREIEERWHSHPNELRRGGGFLLYTILDTVVDGYLPVVTRLEDQVDDIEEALFDNRMPYGDLFPEIFGLKKDAQRFRWAVLPMRDILNPIIRGDVDIFPEEVIAYYRDVYDHAVRVIDQLDTMRDVVNSALEIQLSVVANRNNEISKQLTIIATIFLPLSFVVGFFGQNFDFLVQHISGGGAFWLLGMGTEVITIVIMLILFKRRGWF